MSGSNVNTLINSVQIINNKSGSIETPTFGAAILLRVNVTDSDDNILYVNFTLANPNGTYYINDVNGTKYGDFWNSTEGVINESGVWHYYVQSDDNNTINTTVPLYNGTLTITDVLTKSKQSIDTTLNLYNESLYTIEFYTDSRELLNFTFNSTSFDGNITVQFNVTHMQINSTKLAYYLKINISTNASSEYGLHSGNITIERDAPFYRLWAIPVNVTVSDQYGNIEFYNGSDYTFSSCPQTLTHSIPVRNYGNYKLTNCHPKLTKDGVEVSTSTNFDLAAAASGNAYVNYAYSGTAIETTFFTVSCDSTPTGGKDDTSTAYAITFNPATGCGQSGGGGGGGYYVPPMEQIKQTPLETNVSNRCGNGVCETNNRETPWNCPDDCLGNVFDPAQIFCSPIPNCGNWKESWFINAVMISLVVIMGLFMYQARKAKRQI